MKRTLALALLILTITFCPGCSSPTESTSPPVLEAQLRHSLAGHSEVVWRVAFSPDGQWLAASGYDKTVKVWRLETGAPAKTE